MPYSTKLPEMKHTSGVTKGFILRPDLWNDLNDSLQRFEMPDKSQLAGYVDDAAALVTASNIASRQLTYMIR